MGVYTVFAFWGAEAFAAVFNAIAAIMGGNDFLGLLKTIAILGLIIAATMALLKFKGDELFSWFIMLILFYGGLFVPKVTVSIIDQRNGYVYTVDNVPLGIAFVSSTSSHIGKWLTETFETNFTAVDDERYSKTGMVFGARLVQQLQMVKVEDPTLYRDLTSFFADCVNPEIINQPQLYNDIMESADLMGTIGTSGYLNPGRLTTIIDGGVGQPVNCFQAHGLVTTKMNAEATKRAQYLGNQQYPGDPTALAKITANIQHAEAELLNTSRTAVDAIKQGMAMNMFIDGQATIASIRNDPAATQIAAAVTMAEQSAAVSYSSMAKIAEVTLPRLRVALELMVIALFPVIFLLVIAAGSKGGLVLKTYLMSLVWVQLWAPLYALINWLAWSADKTGLLASLGGAAGPTLGTFHRVAHQALSSQAVTGMLTVSVPIIAYAIVKGGEMAGSSVASSVMSPAQGAAQKSGDALGQGNVSGGNVNWGNFATWNTATGNHSGWNSSWNNASANKDDRSLSFSNPNMATNRDQWGSDTATRGAGTTPGGSIGPGFSGEKWSTPTSSTASDSTGNIAAVGSASQGRVNSSFSGSESAATQAARRTISDATSNAWQSIQNQGFRQAFASALTSQQSTGRSDAWSSDVGASSSSQRGNTWNDQNANSTGFNLSGTAGGGTAASGGGGRGAAAAGALGGVLASARGAFSGGGQQGVNVTSAQQAQGALNTAMQSSEGIRQMHDAASRVATESSSQAVRDIARQTMSSLQKAHTAALALESSVSATNKAGTSEQDTKGVTGQVSENFSPQVFGAMQAAGFTRAEARQALSSGSHPRHAEAMAIAQSVSTGQTAAGISELRAPKDQASVHAGGMQGVEGKAPTMDSIRAAGGEGSHGAGGTASPSAGAPEGGGASGSSGFGGGAGAPISPRSGGGSSGGSRPARTGVAPAVDGSDLDKLAAGGGFGAAAESARASMNAPTAAGVVGEIGAARQWIGAQRGAFSDNLNESAGVNSAVGYARAHDLASKAVAGATVVPPRSNSETARDIQEAMRHDPSLRASVRKAGEQQRAGLQVDESIQQDILSRTDAFRKKSKR